MLALLLSTALNSAPPPTPTGFEGVAAATMASRQTIVDAFTGRWPGYQGEAFATDVLVSSSAALAAQWAVVNNSTNRADLTQWHRIRLDSSAPAANWSATIDLRAYQTSVPEPVVTDGHRYGSSYDRASAGGGVLIESSGAPVTIYGTSAAATFNIRGVRGLHLRNFNIANCAATTTSASRDAAVCLGFIGSSTQPEANVIRAENLGLGLGYHPSISDIRRAPICISNTARPCEQIDVIGCRFNGMQTGFKAVGIRYLRLFGNDFQQVIGDCMIPLRSLAVVLINSLWDERVYTWARLNTERNRAESPFFNAEHGDYLQNGTSGDVGNYSILAEFNVCHARRVQGTDNSTLSFSAQPVAGSSVTIGGTVFEFVAAAPTGTQVLIGAALTNTLDNLKTVFDANTPATCVMSFKASTTFEVAFNYNQWTAITRTTSPAANCTVGNPIRETGGTQGIYNDDLGASYTMEYVGICNYMAGSDGITGTMYNGNAVYDRCTMAVPSERPPNATVPSSGFAFSNDFVPYLTSSRKTAAVTVNHTIRSSVMTRVRDVPGGDVLRTADGTYNASLATLVMDNNRFVNWAASAGIGTRPQDLLAATFGTDANGKWTWTCQDDGLNTQAAFRAEVYARMKLLNSGDAAAIGMTDPATWPAI